MKKMKFILLILMIPGLLSSCKKDKNDPAPGNEIPDIELSLKDKTLVQASNAFGLELFTGIVNGEDANTNVFVS